MHRRTEGRCYIYADVLIGGLPIVARVIGEGVARHTLDFHFCGARKTLGVSGRGLLKTSLCSRRDWGMRNK